MTVRELVALLSSLEHQDRRIVVNGYEGGLEDIREIEECGLIVNGYKDQAYMGTHEEVWDKIGPPPDEVAYLIPR